MSDLKQRPLRRRMRDGLAGLAHGWRRERSLRTQVIASGAAVLVLLAIAAPLPWLVAVLVLLAFGLAAELINAALEALLDRLHPDYDVEIGAAKDMSSAAVLVVNVASAVTFVAALMTTGH